MEIHYKFFLPSTIPPNSQKPRVLRSWLNFAKTLSLYFSVSTLHLPPKHCPFQPLLLEASLLSAFFQTETALRAVEHTHLLTERPERSFQAQNTSAAKHLKIHLNPSHQQNFPKFIYSHLRHNYNTAILYLGCLCMYTALCHSDQCWEIISIHLQCMHFHCSY